MPSELTMTAQVQTLTDQSKSLTIEKLPIYQKKKQEKIFVKTSESIQP